MRPVRRALQALSRIGADPADPADLRTRKALLVSVSVLVLPAGLVWGLLYVVFGEPMPAIIPLGYTVVSIGVIAVFGATRSYRLLRTVELTLILLMPFILSLSLGGIVPSSGVILWSFLSPAAAIAFDGPRRAWRWMAGFLVLVLGLPVLAPLVRTAPVNLPPGIILAFGALNIATVGLICFALLSAFAAQREQARQRVEELVLNILPQQIAERLQTDRRAIADQFVAASILFADVVDFTPMSAELPPDRLVAMLDGLFSDFDDLADRFGLEKIKTIGDCYMVAAGVPQPRDDHAQVLARMALAMRDSALRHARADGSAIRLRIGISSGPVVAGVIGRRRFLYDLWGDAVNTASRMESHGEPGEIQITDATRELLQDAFECRLRGTVQVKGKGPMRTWFLVGERPASGARPA